MRQRLGTIIFIFLLYIALLSPQIESATYSDGFKQEGNLVIGANSEFLGGTYEITGNLEIKPTAIVTLKEGCSITVGGNVTISGQIVNQSTVNRTYEIISTNGEIFVNSSITITGPTGRVGTSYSVTQNGGPGYQGGTCDFILVAKKGNILLNSQISNYGGTGGVGGNAGGSSGSIDGGTGGSGGSGGAGGVIKVVAMSGRIDVKNLLKSVGGAGGKGGTGGADQSFWGGPGAGGSGGIGGKAGEITLLGQDVAFASTASFNLTPGEGGIGGNGGSAGSSGDSGAKGIDGKTGSVGMISVKGGEILDAANTLLTAFPPVSITPQDANAPAKMLQYDTGVPNKPLKIAFLGGEGANQTFYTNTTTPIIKIKVPNDNGYKCTEDDAYDSSPGENDAEYKSGIAKFVIYSKEQNPTTHLPLVNVTQNFTASGVDSDGYFSIQLPTLVGASEFNFNVITYDKYNNNIELYSATEPWTRLRIDQTSPGAPTINQATLSSTDKNRIDFAWTIPTDASGIKDYELVLTDENQTIDSILKGNTYTFYGQYNSKIECIVKARDMAGNWSTASSSRIVYTYPLGANIKSIEMQKTVDTGIKANLTFTSLGTNVAGYEIKYYQIDYSNAPISPEIVRHVGAISALEGQDYIHCILDLQYGAKYRFFIRTYNKDTTSGRLYSDWTEYSKGAVETTGATAPTATVVLTSNTLWEGTVTLTGDVVVPQNIVLTIQPGAIVKFLAGTKLLVDGKLVADGTAGRITFTSSTLLNAGRTNVWKGIYFSPTAANIILTNMTIENAERGLILNGPALTASNVTFKNNWIGIHIGSSPLLLTSCRFEGNVYYGIKEEFSGTRQVNNSVFISNGIAPGYSSTGKLISVQDINALWGSNNQ